MRSLLLQVVVELCLELISLLFVQIGVDDLRDGHATNPVREYGVAQILNCFGFDSLKNSYFGGFIGVGDNEFVVTIRDK